MYLIASECEQEKKYCGFKAFIKLANSNTRRILEILHYAFGDYNNDRKPYKSINIEKQTYAVNKLSKSYFDQININQSLSFNPSELEINPGICSYPIVTLDRSNSSIDFFLYSPGSV